MSLWFATSTRMLKDPKVVSVGEHFGGDTVSVVIALLSEAMLQNKGGTVEYHYRNLAHDAFTEREKAKEIVEAFIDNGFLRLEEGHDMSVVVTFPAWSRHQAAFRKAKSRANKANAEANVTPGHDQSQNVTNRTEQDITEQNKKKGSSVVPTSDAPLSHLLADLVAANDPNGKRPRVTETWAAEEDKLTRLDGRPREEAERLIRWVQADSFWRANCRSMPKFRKQYGQLYANAVAEAEKKRGGQELSPAEMRVNEIRQKREARAA